MSEFTLDADGNVALFEIATGTKIIRRPVDAREILKQDPPFYTLDESEAGKGEKPLAEMTLPELKAKAAAMGLEVKGTTKAAFIAAIEAAAE